MPEPEIRRRRRPAVSCTLCRRRKIRCNREQPCSNCLRARKNVACVYEELPPVSATSLTAETSSNSEPVLSLDPPRGNGSLVDAGIVIRQSRGDGHHETENHENLENHENHIQDQRQTVDKDILFVIDDEPSTSAGSSFDINNGLGLPQYRPELQNQSQDQTQQNQQKEQTPPKKRQKDKDVQSLQSRIRTLEKQLEKRLVQFEQKQQQKNGNTPSASATRTGFPGAVSEGNEITPVSYITVSDPPMHNAVTRQSLPSRSTSSGGRKRRHTQSPVPGERFGCAMGPPAASSNIDGSSTLTNSSNPGFSHPQVVNWPRPQSLSGGFYVAKQKRHTSDKDKKEKDTRHRHVHMTSRSVMHKTRLFGQSHWVNSIVGFRDIFEMIDPLVGEDNNPQAAKVFVDMQRLKHMGRVIKAQRIAGRPAVLHLQNVDPDEPIRGCEDLDLPPRALADELVECYMRSTESMYRILHVPMFRREYNQFYSFSRSYTKHDSAFLAQLRLVLAIGASTHPDHIKLRPRAVRWLYAAQAWHAEPEYKAHLTMQTLQIHVLLLFAREAVGIGGALIWISVGDLVRSAVYMGLHRDPSHLPKRMSLLAAEMRRRLWNTVLELVVATSMDAGGPAMLSVSEFDARPPANLTDEALEEASVVPAAANGICISRVNRAQQKEGETEKEQERETAPAVPKRVYVSDGEMRGVPPYETISEMLDAERSEGVWEDARSERSDVDSDVDSDDDTNKDDDLEKKFTPTSIAIALRRSWPLRLQICQFVNSMGPPGSYADTLVLDRQFRAAYRTLCETIQSYADVDPLLLSMVDLAMKRYVLCLHVPFFGVFANDEAYAYSRRVVLETALRVWSVSGGDSVPEGDSVSEGDTETKEKETELTRQTMLGTGPLRRLVMQASLLVAAELKLQLLEVEGTLGLGLGLGIGVKPTLRPDLMAVVTSATQWSLRGIEAGETNFKGYLLWRLIAVQLDGMRRGMMGCGTATVSSRLALARELVTAGEEAEGRCMPVMEGMVRRGYVEMGLLERDERSEERGQNGPNGQIERSEERRKKKEHAEVDAIARACQVEACPCKEPYRRKEQRRQERQERQEPQQQFDVLQLPTQPLPMPLPTPYSTALDPMDLTVDNWEFLMPDQSLMDNEPLSWLFSGDAGQNIMW